MRKGIISVAGFCLMTSFAYAGSYESGMIAYKDNGEVEGANATLVSTEAGIAGSVTTNNLNPGHVYTMWVAIVNNPAECEMKSADNCTSKDVVERAEMVNSDMTYGDGLVVGSDGKATFRTFIPAGGLESSWLGNGLVNPTGAEIHFALNDHGPAIPGKIHEMMSTARGGCTDESLPGIWPDSARANGTAGPTSSAMAQFAIFKQQ